MSGELCVIKPLLPDRREDLTATLADLPTGEASPLARVPGTHFARWVAAPSVLVFAVEFDHPGATEYLEDLCWWLPDEADRVWRHCAGYPGVADPGFGAWLLEHRVEPGFSVVAFPDATVAEVREALALRARLGAFAVWAQEMPPERLPQAWRDHVDAG